MEKEFLFDDLNRMQYESINAFFSIELLNIKNELDNVGAFVKFNIYKNKILSLYSEIQDRTEKILEYSKFDKDVLGNALAEFLTKTTGEEYVYGKAINFHEVQVDTATGYEYREVNYPVDVVIASSKYREWYRSEENYLDQLVKTGEAIYFDPTAPQEISLFIANEHVCDDTYAKMSIGSGCEFNCDYIKMNIDKICKTDVAYYFIKALVQYCYENDIKNATKEDMTKCMDSLIGEAIKTQNSVLEKIKKA